MEAEDKLMLTDICLGGLLGWMNVTEHVTRVERKSIISTLIQNKTEPNSQWVSIYSHFLKLNQVVL